MHAFMGVVGMFDGSNEDLQESLNPSCQHLDIPCTHLNTSPTNTLKMDSVGILIGRSNTPIWAVEEGYAGIREGQVLE